MSRSHGCFERADFKNSGKYCLLSISKTDGQTILRWISNSRSKFFNHFILSSNSPAKENGDEILKNESSLLNIASLQRFVIVFEQTSLLE